MNLIEFKDYPSTETPLNAENLNQIQLNIENALYYKDGDTYNISSRIDCAGHITGNSKVIEFTLPAPKSLEKISKININSFDITCRSHGKYVLDRQKTGNLTVEYATEHLIRLVYTTEDGTTLNDANNIATVVTIYGISLTFNE